MSDLHLLTFWQIHSIEQHKLGLNGWAVAFSFTLCQHLQSLLPPGPATLLNRSKRSNSFSFLWSNSLVPLSDMLKYFSRKLVFFFVILDFLYFPIGHNGNSSCREGWHQAFCQSSQTVKSLYILLNVVLEPTLLIHRLLFLKWGTYGNMAAIYMHVILVTNWKICL